jgi:hypothetical protein
MTIKSDGGFEALLASMRDLATNGLPMEPIAARVETFMGGTLERGETPEGETWVKKRDGSRPYKNARKKYSQNIVGRSIIMKMAAPDAWGHWGTGYIKRRQMLPDNGKAVKFGNAFRMGMVDGFKAKTAAGRRGYSYYRARGKKITRAPK